ncbi:adenylate kinase [Fervidobacterium nodosum]|uniref:Adenylate kinase n=1 Tax=Fervidobacterium nodosum (strain ATCC 35602 / DSM 5306 / Rt17-B1) TaxID=381764 RepID=KAD_FERNB|nr:adenylate kinase [Fervidobacterium nodosum]A7HM31.1 RecName: Full=Adenylate kinase; Short=AK; AltName: Full=ATP-AMP transphosphorylase; AltName: Full=ATP:AMP phosphotransferase; AltName: Full=Adenylate monophosphate kinase [Fervidobacterium nodosum Rt17-B1]ABS60964.1 Adenylate kinase [Fervidobacterium nodosum Rt17-B1]PHJ14428.1 adenylate kinase [Fervidobacterium sp. SC_NGM5_G05]
MNLIFLGPPGAGKGTYAKRVVEKYIIPHISTGDIFREAIAKGTELGRKVQDIVNSGNLVPDELTNALVEERLKQDDCKKGFILDGYPRTLNQAQALNEMLKKMGKELDGAIYFEVDEETVVQRISTRRVCSKCGKVYNVITLPSKVEGICDDCGGTLIQRDDDKEDIVRSRYRVYIEKTSPLIEYYKNQNKLFTLDGRKSVEEVMKILFNILGGFEKK